MRILLAEDNEHLNYILTLQLQNDGFTVDSCMDGEEAFYYMEQQVYDVILLDRMLPHLSGTDILQKARAQQIHTTIILINALSSLEDKINGLDYGADDYLVKPFEYDELAARIRCVCRRPSKLNIVEEQTIADITDRKSVV